MFGVFSFVAEAYKNKNEDGSLKVKPVVGCEFYILKTDTIKNFLKNKKILVNIKFYWLKIN